MVLYAGTNGYLDPVAVSDVSKYETDLLAWLRARQPALLSGIRDTGKLDEDGLKAALAEFAGDFVAGDAAEQ